MVLVPTHPGHDDAVRDPAVGWRQAFARLRRKFGVLHQGAESEDLLQEALARTISLPHPPANPEAYVARSMRNIAVDQWRHEQTHGGAMVRDCCHLVIDPTPDAEEVAIMRQKLAHVREGIKRLPPRTQEVFLLHRIDGLKYREISAKLAISQSAVEKHIGKAAAFLAEWADGW